MALMDATDKYNKYPYKETGKTPHELWFAHEKPELTHLHTFGQLGFTPFMSKTQRSGKHRDRGELVR